MQAEVPCYGYENEEEEYGEVGVGALVDEDEDPATESFLTTTDFSFNKLAAMLLLVS